MEWIGASSLGLLPTLLLYRLLLRWVMLMMIVMAVTVVVIMVVMKVAMVGRGKHPRFAPYSFSRAKQTWHWH